MKRQLLTSAPQPENVIQPPVTTSAASGSESSFPYGAGVFGAREAGTAALGARARTSLVNATALHSEDSGAHDASPSQSLYAASEQSASCGRSGEPSGRDLESRAGTPRMPGRPGA